MPSSHGRLTSQKRLKKRHRQVQVCELAGARLTINKKPHRCLVEFPLNPGPQPCLVLVTSGEAPETWFDALILVPNEAPVIPLACPEDEIAVYQTALQFLKNVYRNSLPAEPESFAEELCADGIEGWHFQGRLVATGHNLGDDDMEQASFTPCIWNPLVLRKGIAAEKKEADGKPDINWLILTSWKKWKQKNATYKDQADDLYWQLEGMSLWGSEMDWEKKRIIDWGFVNRVRKRFRYLCLPIIKKSKPAMESGTLQKVQPKKGGE